MVRAPTPDRIFRPFLRVMIYKYTLTFWIVSLETAILALKFFDEFIAPNEPG